MTAPRGRRSPRLSAETVLFRLMDADFAVFMSRLVDPAGRPLVAAAHHREWGQLLTTSARLVLLAPRSHGKSTCALAYILWRFWQHGRDAATGRLLPHPTGTFSALLVSATRAQTEVHMSTIQDLLRANRWLFDELLPKPRGAGRATTVWSATHIRLTNGAELRTRAYRTSTRGLHPDLLLLDDVLSDENSRSRRQRDLTWRYFVGTLVPMDPAQLIAIGTPVHRDDLLFRLGPDGQGAALGFTSAAYRALDEESGTTLWPERYSFAALAALREADPTSFSSEYQSDPRDDAASIFPRVLTQRALDNGAHDTLVPRYRYRPAEFVVMGFDPAVSEAKGADYAVAIVAVVDWRTRVRRILTIRRHRGLTLSEQIALIRNLFTDYDISVGMVEDNGFQRWLIEELRRYPETAGKVFPHTTKLERNDPRTGIPGLILSLQGDLWTVPSGDAASKHLAQIWQEELGAFGYRDGRLEGVGEHDDLVLATWFVDQAVRFLERLSRMGAEEEFVWAEDLGIERVRISPDLDADDGRFGWPRNHEDFEWR